MNKRAPLSPVIVNMFVVFVYLGALSVWLNPLWKTPNALVGSGGDPVQAAWWLQWLTFSLQHGLPVFYSHYLNAPVGFNTMWPEITIIYGLLGWPISSLWGVVADYNFVVFVSLLTTGLFTYWLFYRWSHTYWLAALSGLLIMFSPFLNTQTGLGHVDLLGLGGVLLAAIALDEALRAHAWSPRKTGLLLGIGLVWQILSAEEILVQGLLVLLIVLFWFLLTNRSIFLNHQNQKYWATAFFWCSPFLLTAAIYGFYQFLAPGAIHGPLFISSHFTQSLWTILLPSHHQYISNNWSNSLATASSPGNEITGYLGLAVFPLLIWSILSWRRPVVGLALLVLVVGLLGEITTFPEHFPLLVNLLPARFALITDFGLVSLLFLWLRGGPSHKGVATTLLLMALWLPSYPPISSVAIPPFFKNHPALSNYVSSAPTLVLPYVYTGLNDRAMLWQAASGMSFSMPEGYYTRISLLGHGEQFGPPLTPFTIELIRIQQNINPLPITPAIIQEGRSFLRAHKVATIILGPMPHYQALKKLITSILDLRGVPVDGVWIWEVHSHPRQ